MANRLSGSCRVFLDLVSRWYSGVSTLEFTFEVQQLTPNQEMNRTLDRDLLSLPLQSAALKRRLSRR